MAFQLLVDLPLEIVLRILCFLDIDELRLLKRTSASLRHVICNSLALRYRLFAAAAGVENDVVDFDSHDILERHGLLQTWSEGWYHMKFDFRQALPDAESFTVYDLRGGIFFKGDKGGTTVHWCKLPSKSSDVIVGKQVHVDKPLIDISVNVQEHDLIAILTFAPPYSTTPSHNVIEVSLLQLSTGDPHPLATVPVLFINEADVIQPSFVMEIVGDHLVLILAQYTPEGEDANTLYVYDWKTGNLKMSIRNLYRIYQHFIFLSPLILVIPNYRHNTLDVWQIPTANEPASTEPFLVLALPDLGSNANYINVSCRAEPNPRPGGTPHSQSPFHVTPEDAIVIFNVSVHAVDGTSSSYHLFVHRKALLKTVLTHRPEDETGVTHRLLSISERGLIPGQRVRAWIDWGPDISRVLNSTRSPTSWITSTAGQRAIHIPVSDDDTNDSIWKYSKLLDFNPSSVRRFVSEVTNSPGTEQDRRIAMDVSEISIEGLAEPVISKLPYISIDLPFDIAWVNRCWGIIMDDERIIVLLNEPNGQTTIEIMHVGIQQS